MLRSCLLTNSFGAQNKSHCLCPTCQYLVQLQANGHLPVPGPACRLHLLQMQCLSWPGRLGAAVYVSLVGERVVTQGATLQQGAELSEVQETLRGMVESMKEQGVWLHQLSFLLALDSAWCMGY